MAGFELTLYGRIWVTPKADSTARPSQSCQSRNPELSFATKLSDVEI
jgi:hypothetical protein